VNKPHIRRIGVSTDRYWVCESRKAYAYGLTPKDAWIKWAAQLKWKQ